MADVTAALTNRPEARTNELDRLRQRVGDLRDAIGWDVREVRSRVREAIDLRRQVTRHPFITTAVVLLGLAVAARLVHSLLRGDRAAGAKGLRSCGKGSRDVARGPGRGPGTRGAQSKEERE